MNWIQPKFSESQVQPKKKQRLDNELSNVSYSADFVNRKSEKGSSWVDKYRPNFKSELIVHKKKVEEVEWWVQSLGGEGSKLLLLTGPPGSGKLTTLRVVCKELKVQISEWITPPAQQFDPDNFSGTYCSQQRAFEEFLIRGSRYGSVLSSSAFRRIVVVKDVPNAFVRDPASFHELLLKFSSSQDVSIVFVIAENGLILELFPKNVKQNVNITTVNFNPVTKKSVTTALSNIVKKEKLGSCLDSNAVVEISETCEGDLRNAIMSLNFLSTKGSNSRTVKKTKAKGNAAVEGPLKRLLTDPSIDLFHGLGKVLYAKRNDDGLLTYDPNTVVDAFTPDTNTFVNMLQENYLNIFSDIVSVSKASGYLSTSDFILRDFNEKFISREMALSVTVMGLMSSNKTPIKKFQHFSKSKTRSASDLTKSYDDCVKANFCSSNTRTVLLDGVTYLNKLSKYLDNDGQRSVVKELSCFYLVDKHF